MKRLICFSALLLSHTVSLSQVSIGGSGLTIKSGTTFSSQGLVLNPTTDLTLVNNSQSTTLSPASLNTDQTISRKYDFNSPFTFTGTIGIKYSAGELNGNTESNLQLVTNPLTSGNGWIVQNGSNQGGAGTYYVTNNTFSSTDIASISAITLSVSPPSASSQNFCDAATVADLVATGTNLKWYDQSSGGSVLAGTTSLSTGTYYVSQTLFGVESARTSVAVNIVSTPSVTGSSASTRCWTGTLDLGASASAGTLNWYDASSGGTLLGTGTSFTTPAIAVTTSYWVEAITGSCPSTRTEVIATVEACSKITDNLCGITMNASSTKVYCNNVTALSGTTNYHFRIVSAAGTQYYTSTNRWFTFDDITFTYGTPYTIDVQVDRNGGTNWGLYGASCVVTSPNTKIEATQCAASITSVSTKIYAYDVPGATHYRFMIKDGLTTQYVTTTDRWFTLSQFSYTFNTPYTVYVSYEKGGVYSGYGSACTISTPKTELVSAQCNTTINSKNTQILCNFISGATTYRFKIETGGTPIYLDKSVRYFTLNEFAYTLNTTYNVSVAVQMNGTGPFSAYGAVCTIHTPSTNAIMIDDDIQAMTNQGMFDLNLEAFPNPNDGSFTIRATNEGVFNLVNELGQLIQQVKITKEKGYQSKIENLDRGVYFITGASNGVIISQKVIVTR